MTNLDSVDKKEIDALSHIEMCRMWRFGTAKKEWLVKGPAADYFRKRLFEELGGFTPEISKQIGW